MKTINLKIEVEEEGNFASSSLIINGKTVIVNATRGEMGMDTASKAVLEVLENFCRNSYNYGFELNFDEGG